MMDKNVDESQHSIDDKNETNEIRRDLLKKFGKYAATAPAVTFTLMSTYSSKAIASGGASEGGPT